jgi:lipoprotein NlpI/transglutaminase-like putative cysteine protease
MLKMTGLRAIARVVLCSALVLGAHIGWTAPKPKVPDNATAAQGKKSASVAKVEGSPSFTIAAVPSWVTPVVVDANQTLPVAPLQVLLLDRQTRVGPEPTVRYQHSVRQVTESAALQKAAQIQIEFDPSYQKLVLHRLEIWRDGKRIDKLERKLVTLLHRETQLERQIIDGRVTASIVLDDLRVGDRVEWAASLVGDNPVFNGKYVDTEWSSSSLGPVGTLQLRLLAPSQRPIRHRVAESAIEVSERVSDGWRETWFSRRAVPQFHYDPLLPPENFYKDQIELSEFESWAEVASWAEQLFAEATQNSTALTQRASELGAAAETHEQRLRQALDFVQQDVRYFGTEIGPNSHRPAAADRVLQQRFGDCKDKVALLVRLLANLGIEATPTLVSTQLREHVQTRLPSPLAFDHAIVATQLGGQTLWLDPTRQHQRGNPATRQVFGLGHGLVARSGTSDLSKLPPAREAMRVETSERFSFPRLAEEGRLESVTVYHGDMAEWLREAKAAMPEPEFRKFLQAELARFYPGMSEEGPPEIEELGDRNAVRVTQRRRTGNYWRYPERRILVGDFALTTLIAPLRLPDQTPRSQAMRIGMPGRYTHQLRYEFGDDTYSQPSSGRFDESNAHFTLQLRYKSDSRSQQTDGELQLVADSIAAGQWSAYRDQLNKIWPRLAATLSVPPMSSLEGAALRKELAELSEGMRKGSIKVLTSDQANARARLLVMDRQLDAGRLPPKIRAQALVERGIQLDHLGEANAANAALQEAVRLDENLPDGHEALAVNALMRSQDADAIKHAGRALQLAPNSIGPRYTRAWASYFSGNWARSRDELKEILQSSTEVERSYGSIWLYLATRQLGEDGLVATQVLRPTASKPAWPFAVLQLMRGEVDLDDALKAAREGGPNRGRECELYFYAAQKALLDRDLTQARNYLRRSLDTGVVEFNEYAMAKRELERISGR